MVSRPATDDAADREVAPGTDPEDDLRLVSDRVHRSLDLHHRLEVSPVPMKRLQIFAGVHDLFGHVRRTGWYRRHLRQLGAVNAALPRNAPPRRRRADPARSGPGDRARGHRPRAPPAEAGAAPPRPGNIPGHGASGARSRSAPATPPHGRGGRAGAATGPRRRCPPPREAHPPTRRRRRRNEGPGQRRKGRSGVHRPHSRRSPA